MHLYEEYLARHCITLPVVKHTGQGYVFFRENESDSWRIASIVLQEQKQGPSNYCIRVFKPVRGGDKYFSLFAVYEENDVEWDDYEDFVLEWSNVLSNFKIATSSEAFCAAWEMFVYANDEWFSKNIPLDILYGTLDEDLLTTERMHNIYECVQSMSYKSPSRHRVWQDDVMNLVENYAYWLCDIIKNGSLQIPAPEKKKL